MPIDNTREPNRFSTMANLFLSDIRSGKIESAGKGKEEQDAGTPTGRVRRVAPTGKVFSYPSFQPTDPAGSGELNAPEPEPTPVEPQAVSEPILPDVPSENVHTESTEQVELVEETHKSTHVIGVYCNHLHGQSNKALSQFARFLANQDKLVAVLKLEAWSVNLRLYYRKADPPKLPALDMQLAEPEEYNEDVDSRITPEEMVENPNTLDTLWAQLESLREKLDYVVISWGPEFGRFEGQITQLLDSACVVASPEREHLVSSYQFIKSLKGSGIHIPLGIFIADVDEETLVRL